MWPVELSSEMKFTFTFQGPADSFYNKRPTQGEGFPSVPEMRGNRERRKKFNGGLELRDPSAEKPRGAHTSPESHPKPTRADPNQRNRDRVLHAPSKVKRGSRASNIKTRGGAISKLVQLRRRSIARA
jgi:hypothetical protein